MANDKTIVRQNQSMNARELLVSKGYIDYVNAYEFMLFVELWSDFCVQGITDDIKKRFKSFDAIIDERKLKEYLKLTGVSEK
jgi:hypothetical protein